MANMKTIYHPETGEKGVEVSKLPTIRGDMKFTAYGKNALGDIMQAWDRVRKNRCRVISFRMIPDQKVRIAHA